MNAAWLTRYLDAWVAHPLAGSPDGAATLAQLQEHMSPSVRYEDIPTGSVFTGHDGIAGMCAMAHAWAPDLTFRVRSAQIDGSMFAFENVAEGTNSGALGSLPATGRRFVLRGVSVGEVGDVGLVVGQRDYWDLVSFLRQVGAFPPVA